MKGFYCSRFALLTINFLYLITAVLLIATAAYAKSAAIITSIGVVGGIIACGLFLFLVAFLGLVATMRHSQQLLFFYVVILFVLFVLQFSIACACLALNSYNEKALVEKAWKSSSDEVKLSMMKQLNCCGFERTDNMKEEMGYPRCVDAKLKCCENSKATCCIGSQGDPRISCPCTTSCWRVVSETLDWATKLTGAFGLLFSIIEIIGVWLALRYRHLRNPLENPSF